jgi:flagella synthesis protein FlgN
LGQQKTFERADLLASLRAEHAAYQRFLNLLRSEHDYLLCRNAEALLDLSQEKSEQVQELARLGERRSEFLLAHRYAADRRGMSAWLSANSGDDCAVLWSEVVAFADQARSLNEVNGALITTRLAFNQQALDALSGMLSPVRTYGRDGHTESASLASHLGTA